MHVTVPVLKSGIAILLALTCLLFGSTAVAKTESAVHHELEVSLRPDDGGLIVTDRLRFSKGAQQQLLFTLNKGLRVNTPDGSLEKLPAKAESMHQPYRLILAEPRQEIALSIQGKLLTPDYRGMGGMPAAIISPEGVYLDSGSAWYPVHEGIIDGFRMRISLPDEWESVSQGKRSIEGSWQQWQSDSPEQEIYLLAGAFTRFTRQHGDLDLSVYLLNPDQALANTYLNAVQSNIDRYKTLFGDYPFPKFAVVENRWQTGYGMPSFTLLGSRVIRLPFIPYTSLPHEIVHNWLGNGIWVDYGQGNWSEGLTAYLADHLMKETRGEGADYRRKALQKYADFASDEKDFPLRRFVSRHSDASQAVGYSKSLMLFHMLRQQLGDETFIKALRQFWNQYRFTEAGFDDLLAVFDKYRAEPGDNRQWLERTGAPLLSLENPAFEESGQGYRLTFSLVQQQSGPAFRLSVPAFVTLQGVPEPVVHRFSMLNKRIDVSLDVAAKPLRLDIDPQFDALRLLDKSERPASLGRLFGSSRWYLVLPTAVSDDSRNAWLQFARAWRERYPSLKLVDDTDMTSIPVDADMIIAGWSNLLFNEQAKHLPGVAGNNNPAIAIGSSGFDTESHSVVVTGRSNDRTIGFIGADSPASVSLLARKLPHYSSYGQLVFDSNGKNLLKRSSPIGKSILTHHFSQPATGLNIPGRSALID